MKITYLALYVTKWYVLLAATVNVTNVHDNNNDSNSNGILLIVVPCASDSLATHGAIQICFDWLIDVTVTWDALMVITSCTVQTVRSDVLSLLSSRQRAANCLLLHTLTVALSTELVTWSAVGMFIIRQDHPTGNCSPRDHCFVDRPPSPWYVMPWYVMWCICIKCAYVYVCCVKLVCYHWLLQSKHFSSKTLHLSESVFGVWSHKRAI